MKTFRQIYRESLNMFNSEYYALNYAVTMFTKQHVNAALDNKTQHPHLPLNEVYPLKNIEENIDKNIHKI
jgi:hypothetical protein